MLGSFINFFVTGFAVENLVIRFIVAAKWCVMDGALDEMSFHCINTSLWLEAWSKGVLP